MNQTIVFILSADGKAFRHAIKEIMQFLGREFSRVNEN